MIPVPSPAGSGTEFRFLRSTPGERQLRHAQIHYKVETDKIILQFHQARTMGLNKATAHGAKVSAILHTGRKFGWTKLHATTLEPFRSQDEECACVIQRPLGGKT